MGMKAEEPDYQKQFEAAVHVIQGLPKNGSYRPSYEEMLRFYSYYKQATMGQCQIPRPGFWDPIGRYKWDAWNRLGKMTKEEAMIAYIAEMKKAAQKVIDTVPMDESSVDMFVYFEPLYEMIHDMPRPPESFFKKKSVQLNSKTLSLHNGALNGPVENLPASGEYKQTGPSHADEAVKGSQMASDSESEVFCDSLEQMEPDQASQQSDKLSFPLTNHSDQTGEKGLRMTPGEKDLSSSPEDIRKNTAATLIRQEVELQMANAIQALQEDMRKVMERLRHLESLATLQGHTSMWNPLQPITLYDAKEPRRWPIRLSPGTTLFLLAWPFIVQWLLWRFQSRKR
ncbi:acyl-CoA-binding domain-containing protein 4 [Hemicordylus capensis]|uniref:acyl-CoA-binding domain-containing protein 4 n=1 Tax=Hemicordylus capensis TaxID=884348 RepID=UPI002303EBAC|nr:acyl-CoA-binding domain-containing protein 4 [Hemicordylus capensis]XP_053121206.1 acyl-CoA-binding domain-containing protein 4 [Hemicordylus capensis]XP_053121208.1 acyl-CoA-binding domain-containing protein 4 [Hemicordylus capensis]